MPNGNPGPGEGQGCCIGPGPVFCVVTDVSVDDEDELAAMAAAMAAIPARNGGGRNTGVGLTGSSESWDTRKSLDMHFNVYFYLTLLTPSDNLLVIVVVVNDGTLVGLKSRPGRRRGGPPEVVGLRGRVFDINRLIT